MTDKTVKTMTDMIDDTNESIEVDIADLSDASMARSLHSAGSMPETISADEQEMLTTLIKRKQEVDLAKQLSDLQFENLTMKLQLKYNLVEGDTVDKDGTIVRAKPVSVAGNVSQIYKNAVWQ